MILEYCAGGDLAQAMTRRRHEAIEESLAKALIRQLAAGECGFSNGSLNRDKFF